MQATVGVTSSNSGSHVLDRVLVGIDARTGSVEAARQAAVLVERYGELTLLAVSPPPPRVGLDVDDEFDPDHVQAQAEEALAAARRAVGTLAVPATRVVRGHAWNRLADEAERARQTLIAVGSHDRRRLGGILAGSTATHLIHKAPCSVLLARPAGRRFPQRVLVGLDGSPESALAYATGRRIADRFDCELHAVVAVNGDRANLAEIVRLTGERYEQLPGEPVDALVAASVHVDLLVVGSRGLHGVRALGSVSERVAHTVGCSTLIVRPPRGPQ